MRLQCLLLLTACLTSTLALPGSDPATLSTVPKPATTAAGDCSGSGILCIAEKHVVYNQTSGTCGCEWISGFGPAVADTKICPTVRCKDKYHPVSYPGKKHCTCEPDEEYLDPPACPLIKCTSSTRPVYHPETKSCSCDPIPLECPNSIICAAGAHKVQDPTTKKCSCKITNPIPKTCPQLKCVENYHVVYHPDTDNCACTPDCPDLFCIAEQKPTYDSSANSCSCKYIEGLEPSPIHPRAEKSSPITSSSLVPTKAILPTACSEIMCISEKYPVLDEATGICNCEWITGPAACSEIMCISEKHPVLDEATGKCNCEWITGSTGCSDIMCIPEMHPVYNETAGRCECEWMDIFEPPIVSWTSSDPSAMPTPLPTPT